MSDSSELIPEVAAERWSQTPRMNELDALTWRSERHPQQSSTVLTVLHLDHTPDWNRLVSDHQYACEQVLRSTQRVLEPALPVGPPAWVPDQQFTLDYHLRRVQLPGVGTHKALLDYAATFALAPLDRGRALWEAQLVTGLEGGKAAYLLKMHHSLSDAARGNHFLSLLQSRSAEPEASHTGTTASERVELTLSEDDPLRLAVDEVGERIRSAPSAAGWALAAGKSLLADPSGTASEAVRYAASLRQVLVRNPAKPSPLLRKRTGRVWRLGVLECRLDDLKHAARAAGGTVNDAFVAALLGGIRHYHNSYGIDIDELPVAMPVSVRPSEDPLGGNKFAGALFAAPVAISDPVERIRAIGAAVLVLRGEPALETFSLVAPLVNRLPSTVGATASRMGATADLAASSMPGVSYQTYLAAAKVERLYTFGPLPGVAVMAAMVSHVGTCCFGFNIDGTAVEDTDELMECFALGLDEVLAIGERDRAR